jgi:DNA-directed RNA polymerase subunit beta'
MGRLIPAGTGMKYYRNVKIDYDPTVNQKKEEEYDDFPLISGGLDLPVPMDVPGVEVDDFDEIVEGIDDFETEEEFTLDDSLEIEDEIDDL